MDRRNFIITGAAGMVAGIVGASEPKQGDRFPALMRVGVGRISPHRTVIATGGCLTITALQQACNCLEDPKWPPETTRNSLHPKTFLANENMLVGNCGFLRLFGNNGFDGDRLKEERGFLLSGYSSIGWKGYKGTAYAYNEATKQCDKPIPFEEKSREMEILRCDSLPDDVPGCYDEKSYAPLGVVVVAPSEAMPKIPENVPLGKTFFQELPLSLDWESCARVIVVRDLKA
jgi:hypothetical protein